MRSRNSFLEDSCDAELRVKPGEIDRRRKVLLLSKGVEKEAHLSAFLLTGVTGVSCRCSSREHKPSAR